jgi:hypothetical protein
MTSIAKMTDPIAAALEFNSTHEDAAEFWTEADAVLVAAGTPKIYTTAVAPGTGWNIRIVAYLGIELENGSNAACGEPVICTMRRKGGMTSEKAAAWWGRKNFGDYPIVHRHLV